MKKRQDTHNKYHKEIKCEAFHMEISFIYMQMNQNLRVNKTNFHLKGFALGLALKQRRKRTRKSPIQCHYFSVVGVKWARCEDGRRGCRSETAVNTNT